MYKVQLVRLQEEQILLCTWLLHTSTDAFGHIISDSTKNHWEFLVFQLNDFVYSPFKY